MSTEDNDTGLLASVVIAAHNEEAVIGACLDALLGGSPAGRLDVVVVPNGCSDDTASVAADRGGVRVIDIAEAGKALALRAGDKAALGYPRIYLDADIVVPPGAVEALTRHLRESPGVLAVVPVRVLDTAGRPPLVRAYFAVNELLPTYAHGLFGRGLIALSQEGRGRFDAFPLMVADDLFLDSLFAEHEKETVAEVSVHVATPYRTRDLFRRLVRVRRGNAAMRAAGRSGEVSAVIRSPDRWAWLREVVLPRPRLLPAGLVYATLTALAAAAARREPRPGRAWGRDDSTREAGRPSPR